MRVCRFITPCTRTVLTQKLELSNIRWWLHISHNQIKTRLNKVNRKRVPANLNESHVISNLILFDRFMNFIITKSERDKKMIMVGGTWT